MSNDLEKTIEDHQETGRNPSNVIPERQKKSKKYIWIAIAVIAVLAVLILTVK